MLVTLFLTRTFFDTFVLFNFLGGNSKCSPTKTSPRKGSVVFGKKQRSGRAVDGDENRGKRVVGTPDQSVSRF